VSEQVDEILLEAEAKMDKAVEVAREDFATIRTGRANPAMFAKVMVDYYGTLTPVNQLASFASPEARMMIVTPYDKGSLTEIEKAIRDSDLGVNPTSDGTIIRVSLPTLTEERRKEYIKTARQKAEDARISVRNIRRHAKESIERMVKDHEVGEDEAKRAEKHLEEVTHKTGGHIDEILKHKEAELLEV
jgi:ribosome recycling factor